MASSGSQDPGTKSQSWKGGWAWLGPYREKELRLLVVSLAGWEPGEEPHAGDGAEGLIRQAPPGPPVVDHKPGTLPSDTDLEIKTGGAPKVENDPSS